MSDKKPREYWIYEGKNNCAPLLFVYDKPQKIKIAAPENFDEHYVIEHQAYTDALKMLEELAGALEFYNDEIYHYYGVNQEPEVLQDRGDHARQSLESYRKWKGE